MATLNFPLRIVIVERPDGLADITWDLPSSQIPGKESNETLATACYFVDGKIEQLIRFCSGTLPEEEYRAILALSENAKGGAWAAAGNKSST